MKTPLTPYFKKAILLPTVLLLLLSLSSGPVFSQAVIYKTDGTSLIVSRIDTSGRIRSYNLPADDSSTVHLISRDVLDSIRFPNGRVQVFNPRVGHTEDLPDDTDKMLKNSAGINIFPLFNASLNPFYERLVLKNRIGLKASLYYNGGHDYTYYGTMNQTSDHFFSAGVNYYFLNSQINRLGTGLSFVTGKFCEEHYIPFEYRTDLATRNKFIIHAILTQKVFSEFFVNFIGDFPLGFGETVNGVQAKLELSMNF